MLRSLLPALILLAVTLVSHAQAADNAALLSTLRQEQAAVYGTVREFHMQTLLSGDPTRTATLKAAVEKSRKAYAALPGNTGNAALDTALKSARAAWVTYSRLVLANRVVEDGYTDDNLIGDLYVAADALNDALAAAIKAVPAGKQRALADRAHAADLLMQRTVASYLKRGAQMSPDVGSEDPFDVGEATKQIDKEIQALARALPKSAAMHSVRSKWGFISKSLANYNEKTVPFIVDRYAAQINEGLLQVVAELDAK